MQPFLERVIALLKRLHELQDLHDLEPDQTRRLTDDIGRVEQIARDQQSAPKNPPPNEVLHIVEEIEQQWPAR